VTGGEARWVIRIKLSCLMNSTQEADVAPTANNLDRRHGVARNGGKGRPNGMHFAQVNYQRWMPRSRHGWVESVLRED
jgi:hypothetical protein